MERKQAGIRPSGIASYEAPSSVPGGGRKGRCIASPSPMAGISYDWVSVHLEYVQGAEGVVCAGVMADTPDRPEGSTGTRLG